MLLSQSRLQEALFFQLAASALQAEVGDQEQREVEDEEEGEDNRRQRECYFLPEDYFPSWVKEKKRDGGIVRHFSIHMYDVFDSSSAD